MKHLWLLCAVMIAIPIDESRAFEPPERVVRCTIRSRWSARTCSYVIGLSLSHGLCPALVVHLRDWLDTAFAQRRSGLLSYHSDEMDIDRFVASERLLFSDELDDELFEQSEAYLFHTPENMRRDMVELRDTIKLQHVLSSAPPYAASLQSAWGNDPIMWYRGEVQSVHTLTVSEMSVTLETRGRRAPWPKNDCLEERFDVMLKQHHHVWRQFAAEVSNEYARCAPPELAASTAR